MVVRLLDEIILQLFSRVQSGDGPLWAVGFKVVFSWQIEEQGFRVQLGFSGESLLATPRTSK